jgi:DNA polymerase-3 subunit alpha
MKIAQILGGFSPQESDLLRKAVSKKEKEKITTFKTKFITNASKKIGEKEATLLFSQIENFAQYAFNKSHAVAYAHITYWLSEKKFQDPSNFFLEYVKIKGIDFDIINEASLLGVKIKLPDIRYPFGLASKTDLILPLYIIKGIGKNISHIFEEAKLSSLEDFFNFIINKNINRNIVELIIKSGALDYFNNNRKNLLRETTQRMKGKVQQLEDIKSTLFGEREQKSTKKVETTLQDYAQYEIESIGFPLSLMSQKGLSNTLIDKYLNRQKVYLDGYVYRDFIVDNSAMIYSRVYNKNLKRLIKHI